MEISILFSILRLLFVFSDKISEISAQKKNGDVPKKNGDLHSFLHSPADFCFSSEIFEISAQKKNGDFLQKNGDLHSFLHSPADFCFL